MINDVIIIGGGASGLFAAVYLKQNNSRLAVRILESQPRVGKKLALTGNGRCNITNTNIDLSRYHGENTEFARFALEKYDRFFCEDFFEGLGVPFVFEEEKGYPASLQAASVVDCLRFAAEESGVITHLETKVTDIRLTKSGYMVIADKMQFMAKNVIIAAGLLSGGERLGCDGSILALLKKAGYQTAETFPSIVQLKTETDIVKQLKGIKIDALVSLKHGGKLIREEFGEVLFCDYGLSGPPVLQVSGMAARLRENCEISLDLRPQTDYSSLLHELRKRAKALRNRNLDEFFTGMLNKRLGQVILKNADCRLNEKTESLDEMKLKKITSLIKGFTFKVTGNNGFLNSQATSGGVLTHQFSDKTMESKSNKGLYAIGEILDIDGDCGGFNLQWAWSSAAAAAEAILEKSK